MRRVTLLALTMLVASQSARAQLPSVDSLSALVPQSSFVFVAVVHSRSVPAAPGVPTETRRLVGLQVIDTIQAPRSMPLRRANRLRLLVDSSDVPPVGSKAVVFATGWLAGEQIALIQVARFTVRTRAEWSGLEATYDSLRFAAERAAFRSSVAASDLTAVAVVTSVVAIPDTRPPIARSEHDPVWARVSIAPLATLKGSPTLTGGTVALLIPTSRNHIWDRVPAVVPGDTVLFVLASIAKGSPLAAIDSTARFALADSVGVRPARDTVLLRTTRRP